MDQNQIIQWLTSGAGMGGTLVVYLLVACSLFAIANQEREEFGWFAFIPILNLFLMCKLGRVNPLFLLLLLVPCINLFVFAYLWAEIGKGRDKSIWGWLMLIPCFWYVSPIVIALGKK